MRFTRYCVKSGGRIISPSKLAAAAKFNQRENSKFPLLTDWISSNQELPQARCDRMLSAREERVISDRNIIAFKWRSLRSSLFLLSTSERSDILSAWGASSRPKSVEYFADFLRHWSRK